uniref:6-cysteine protein n=1 Tax=Parastrongyloides trichosuri TaxID=131310 RepID=A0A0N4Z727_PARTI
MFDYKVTPIQLVTDYSVKECLTEAKNLLVYEMTDKYLPKLIELKNVNMYTAKSNGIYIFFSIPDIRESGLHMPCFITKLFGGEPIFEYKTKCLALSKDTTENVDICEYTSVDRSVIFDFALKVKDHSEVKFYENENFEVQRMMLTNKGIKPTINMKLKTNGHVNVHGTEILKFEYKVVLTREKTYNTSKTIFFINRIQNIHETKKINYITSYDIPSLLPFCKIRIGTYSILEKIIFEDGTKKLTINYTELKEKRIMDHFELLKDEVIYKKRNKKILELACFYKTIVSSFIYTNVFHFHNFPNFDRPVNRGKQIEYRKNLTYTTIYCCLVIILMILAIYVNMIWYIKGKRIKGRIKKYRRFKDGERTSESGTLPLNLEYRKKIIEMRRNVYKIKENKSDNEENKSFSRVSISGKEKRS